MFFLCSVFRLLAFRFRVLKKTDRMKITEHLTNSFQSVLAVNLTTYVIYFLL